MRHIQTSGGTTFAPAFDKHMAEVQKAEGTVMKCERLAREETELEEARGRQPDAATVAQNKAERDEKARAKAAAKAAAKAKAKAGSG